MHGNKNKNAGACSNDSTNSDLDRRQFLALTGAAGMVAGSSMLPVMAGPFVEEVSSKHPVPLDKKLSPAWIASLYERGMPMTYKGWKNLRYIGMPVGGLCAGHVYLGGDGRLWLWDIFNRRHEGVVQKTISDFKGQRVNARGGSNYIDPPEQIHPFDHGFAIRVHSGNAAPRRLDHTGFREITFTGQYPIGTVEYSDREIPVAVKLEAMSPFIPLNTADSSLPATVLNYTITNTSGTAVDVEISGSLENPVLLDSADIVEARRQNRVVRGERFTAIEFSAARIPEEKRAARPDIVFEDFEKPAYDGWTVEGTAFGDGPIAIEDIPSYQGDVNGTGKRVVNSHNVRSGGDVPTGDRHTGTLLSREFTITRRFINFRVGGGAHKGRTCINLLIGDEVVRTATGHNHNRMRFESFSVGDLEGKKARFQVVDREPGPWGNIGIDDIIFSDSRRTGVDLDRLPDFGTMTLALLEPRENDLASASLQDAGLFGDVSKQAEIAMPRTIRGGVGRRLELAPGAAATVSFVITWHFPNITLPGLGLRRRWYAGFDTALAVAKYVAGNFARLTSETRRWRDTWYDSSLPHWLLDRTFANASTLATNTCYRLDDGRFWAWEGIGCCAGTCTHVWHYAQAVARLFPDLERVLRERVDLGVAFDNRTGRIRFRAENNNRDAADGQAGVILRSYREHLMSTDNAFLGRIWPNLKHALQYLIAMDSAEGGIDGMIEGEQHNTLDAEWFGKIPAIASLYLAALAGGAAMASEVGDTRFEKRCRAILEKGQQSIRELFNGEYYIQIEHPAHLNAIGIGRGCHIDQVIGQGWAFQVGLGRLLDETRTRAALESLWKYNFNPDMGPLRASLPPRVRGRPYAIAGDAGLMMCTWPLGGRRDNWERFWQFGYFNECMSGFEYQAAAHMVWEGLIEKGLAVARAIHDRYHASLRNPYNEVECSDHYARAMASYGVFLASCGYEYNGPEGLLGFAPRLSPENFRAAFTAAEGWGTISQKRQGNRQVQGVVVRWGTVRLERLAFELVKGKKLQSVTINGQPPESTRQQGKRLEISLKKPLNLAADQSLEVVIETG